MDISITSFRSDATPYTNNLTPSNYNRRVHIHWSQVADEENRVARILQEFPKHGVTSRPLGDTWRETSKALSCDFLDDIRLIRKQDDNRELQAHGSVELARELHETSMIDIYRFLIAPVLVGRRASIFSAIDPASSMKVTHHRVTDSGVVSLELVPGNFVNDLKPVVKDGRETLKRNH